MKVILLQPPPGTDTRILTNVEPLGIAYVGAAAAAKGHDVVLIDLAPETRSDQALVEAIGNPAPDLVGITSFMHNVNEGLRLARLFKREWNCRIVFGGPYPSICPELVKNKEVDFVVLGEGEPAFCDLLDHLETRGGAQPGDIPNLVYLDHGELRINPRRPHLQDLDRLPLPMRDGLPMDKYYMPGFRRPLIRKRVTCSILTTRGCPHQCYFCASKAVWSRKRYRRAVPPVIEEMRHLASKYRATNLVFHDEDLNADRKHSMELYRAMVESGLDFHWIAFSRLDGIDEPLAEWMARSGCETLFIGIETIDEEMSGRVGKKMDFGKIIGTVKTLHRKRIIPNLSFIIGFPWEDRRLLQDNERLIKKIPYLFIDYTYATPFPGTKMHEDATKEKLIEVDDPGKYDLKHVVMRTRFLSREEIADLRKQMVRSSYFSGRLMLRVIRTVLADPLVLRMLILDLLYGSYLLMTSAFKRKRHFRDAPDYR